MKAIDKAFRKHMFHLDQYYFWRWGKQHDRALFHLEQALQYEELWKNMERIEEM